jgi:hypothetical protein
MTQSKLKRKLKNFPFLGTFNKYEKISTKGRLIKSVDSVSVKKEEKEKERKQSDE